VIEPEHESEQVAKDAMLERLGLELATYDAGYTKSAVSVISSGLHALRGVFDVMATDGEEAVANIAARINSYPTALEQYQRTLREEADAGRVSARAQLLAVAEQCDAWTDPARDDFFHGLTRRLAVSAAFTDELGRPVRPAGVPWGADMRHFTARGIPCTMAGTPGIELAHAVDERVPLAELTTLARATVRLLARAPGLI